jgi:thiosulfate reductase/polysulfide reductase chain A
MGFKKYESAGGFGTPSGKIHLHWEDLAESPWNQDWPRVELAPEYRENTDRYPFILVSYRTIYHSGSGQWTHNNPQLRDGISGFHENPLMMNPGAAATLGIAHGDTVTVESPAGSMRVSVNLTEGIRPDCVGLAHGFGSTVGTVATVGEGISTNLLIPDSGTTLNWQDLIGGESHVSTRVRIAR